MDTSPAKEELSSRIKSLKHEMSHSPPPSRHRSSTGIARLRQGRKRLVVKGLILLLQEQSD